MMTYVGVALMLVGLAIASADQWKRSAKPASTPLILQQQPEPEWPLIAPDGVTGVTGINIWAKIAGEDDKWVMWSRGPNGGVVWRYVRRMEVSVTQIQFSEIEGPPWPRD